MRTEEEKRELLKKMRAAVGQAELLENREKGNLDSIANTDVTISDYIRINEGDDKHYYFFIIAEDGTHYYSGGSQITSLIDQFGDDIKGTVISIGLAEPTKANKNRTFRQVKVIGIAD